MARRTSWQGKQRKIPRLKGVPQDYNQAVTGYYAVFYPEVFGTEGMQNLSNITSEEKIRSIKEEFIGILNNMIDYERQKERKYIQNFINQYGEIKVNKNGEILKNILENAIGENANPVDFVKAFQYIHIAQRNLNNELNQLDYDIKQWDAYIKPYLNDSVMKAAENAIEELGDNIVNMTPQQVTNAMITGIRSSQANDVEFNKFVDLLSEEITSLVKNNKYFGKKNWTFSKEMYKIEVDSKKLGTKEKIIETYKSKIIKGLLNGLSQEVYIVFSGGTSTARVQKQFLTETGRKLSVQGETDVLAVVNAKLKSNDKILDIISNLKTEEQVRKILDTVPEDNFILHYSSKDFSIAQEAGSNIQIKIKGSGSIDSRIPILRELADEGGISYDSIDTLVFRMINSGAGLMYNGSSVDIIEETIASMAAEFMFEDYAIHVKRMISGIPAGNEIHLYMLSGRFVPLSSVLSRFKVQLDNTIPSAYGDSVRVRITPSSAIFRSQNKDLAKRWEENRDAYIKATTMEIKLTNNLLKGLHLF